MFCEVVMRLVLLLMFLSVLNPKANEGDKKHYRGNNVEHETTEVHADDFEVEGESSHFCFPFRCVLLRWC